MPSQGFYLASFIHNQVILETGMPDIQTPQAIECQVQDSAPLFSRGGAFPENRRFTRNLRPFHMIEGFSVTSENESPPSSIIKRFSAA